jgi:hypothetical protein
MEGKSIECFGKGLMELHYLNTLILNISCKNKSPLVDDINFIIFCESIGELILLKKLTLDLA